MNDKRKFVASFSVKVDTNRQRFELSPAVLHGGSEGQYRVRIDRRWYDGPASTPQFLTREQVAQLLVATALGALQPLPPSPPDYRQYTRCSVILQRNGEEYTTQCTVISAPIRAYDGKFYVFIHALGRGRFFAPVKNIIVRVE